MTQATLPPPSPQAVAAAHRRVRGDSSIQFDFPWVEAERTDDPEWLRALARSIDAFFRALGPFWEVVFWVMVALLAAILIASFHAPLRAWLMGLVRRSPEPPSAEAPIAAAAARALLAEAEALAARGEYDAAVHLLLARSIEDIGERDAKAAAKSLTARDIVTLDALPAPARAPLATLVRLVERSIFARRALGAGDWDVARDAYRRFAL